MLKQPLHPSRGCTRHRFKQCLRSIKTSMSLKAHQLERETPSSMMKTQLGLFLKQRQKKKQWHFRCCLQPFQQPQGEGMRKSAGSVLQDLNLYFPNSSCDGHTNCQAHRHPGWHAALLLLQLCPHLSVHGLISELLLGCASLQTPGKKGNHGHTTVLRGILNK